MADSIREALTGAFEKHSTSDETPANAGPAADETPVTGGADDSAPAGDVPATDEATPSNESDDAAAAAVPATPAAPAPAAATTEPPPASWSNEERAAWSTLPEAARKAVLRREGEMNRALQTSATARRRVEALDKLADVYKPLLDSYGVTVEQALPGLLATRAVLEVGTPEQKAQLLANVCADFGLDITLLDTALQQRYANGVPTPRYSGQGQPDLNKLVEERLNEHPMVKAFNSAQQERARSAIAGVQTQPHFEAVRHTMADVIDQAKALGRSIDVDSAYRVACQLHGLDAPAPAAAAQSVSDAARTLAAARNAAASVSGAPKPTPARKPGEGSLRDELTANLNAASRRK
jgi:hypothetical protein